VGPQGPTPSQWATQHQLLITLGLTGNRKSAGTAAKSANEQAEAFARAWAVSRNAALKREQQMYGEGDDYGALKGL
jgi:hypothetical protein